jgi:hypothetical protein
MMLDLGEKPWILKTVLSAGMLIVCCCQTSLAVDFITGIVHNQTNNRPAASDEVILLGTGQDAREEARAKTDSQGAFTLELQNSHKPHLVRVVHQGVNYDQKVSDGGAISIEVADVTPLVKGITGGIEIIRAGAHGNMLHVSEMVEIKNNSNPPLTQTSDRTFEVYLPRDATIDSVLAAGPNNIGTMISAMPVHGEAGRYTVDFPLRPGATKFAFNYDLPYDGRATFHTKNMYPLQQLAVMIPPTMTFASGSPAFQVLPVGNDKYKVEAAEQLKAGEGPEFEISGLGALPSMQAQGHAPPKPSADALSAPASSARGGLEAQTQVGKTPATTPVSKSTAPPVPSQRWTLGVGFVLMLGTFGLLVLRRKHPPTHAITRDLHSVGQAGRVPASLVEALKEGLFQLETDRLQGTIRGEEYAAAKQALEGTIAWALARAEAQRGTTLTQAELTRV